MCVLSMKPLIFMLFFLSKNSLKNLRKTAGRRRIRNMCDIGTYLPSMDYSKSSLGTFIEFESLNLFDRNLTKKNSKVL